jgi:hypothetical protein
MYLTFQLFCMMGICKYISVVPGSDTSFDMIKVKINYNYVLGTLFFNQLFCIFLLKFK